MDTAIRQPARGCFGSGKVSIQRATGDVCADLLFDNFNRADPAERLEIARQLFVRLGEASAEFPTHIPVRASAVMRIVVDQLGLDPDGREAAELLDLYEGAEERRNCEIADKALAEVESDLCARIAQSGIECMSGMALPDVAELVGLKSYANIAEIVQAIAPFAANLPNMTGIKVEQLLDQVRSSGERGRKWLNRSRIESNEAIGEELEQRGKAGLPLFELYDVDPATRSPTPDDYYAAIAEREALEKAEADERTARAFEAGIADGRGSLALADILAHVRVTARTTRPAPIHVETLVGRTLKSLGYGDDEAPYNLRNVIEVSAEVARERRDLPYVDSDVEARATAMLVREGIFVEALPCYASAGVATPAALTLLESSGLSSTPTSRAATREEQMEALTYVPGLVGDLVDFITATSMKPNRTLAFAAVLPLIGTLVGRLYKSERSTRTNLYTLGLAPSGHGKDHARACIDIIVERAGLSAWLGGSKIASSTGMRRRVEDHPAIMWMIDEFGGFMRQISDTRNSHNHQIRDYLLEFFEKAGDVFRGADYAGEQGRPIHHPNVSLHGLSTPTDFWGACQSLSASDGLLARFMVFTVGNMLKPRMRPAAHRDEPPAPLIEGLRNLTRARVGGNMNGMLNGSAPVKAMTVPFGENAEDAFYAAADRFDAMAFAKKGRPEESIFARVVENALKIAMIVAIGLDPDRPVITVERFEHGLAVSEHCAETTLREIKGRLADNDRQREHVDVFRMIVEAGWAGIGHTTLLKRIRGRFAERRLNEILQTLEKGSKEIISALRPTKGRPAMRYVAVENIESDGAES